MGFMKDSFDMKKDILKKRYKFSNLIKIHNYRLSLKTSLNEKKQQMRIIKV